MENGHAKAVDCPDRVELAAFVTGNLSARALKRSPRHVENCSACETILSALDDHADALVCRLRGTAIPVLAAEEPVPPELLAAAQSCYSKDPGRSTDGPRRLGKFELLEEL